MSRIDEALRRVATDRGQLGAIEETIPDVRSRSTDRSLTEYPIEEQPSEEQGSRRRSMAGLSGSSLIAAPRTGRRGQSGMFDPAADGKLILADKIAPECIEKYSRLAAVLHEAQTQRGLKTLMVSSALPNEGKTLTVTNLALTLSESYKRRVLLIDADLRRPSIHTMFQVPNGVGGLSDALRSSRGSLSLVEISPKLTILPGGHPDNNPMAGLTSERMKTILEDASERFDWVLVDTPPAVLLPDAQLLARLTDAVLLVIAAGRTPFAMVQRAVTEFGADRIIGTVLNRATEGITPASYYGGYYRSTTAANSGR